MQIITLLATELLFPTNRSEFFAARTDSEMEKLYCIKKIASSTAFPLKRERENGFSRRVKVRRKIRKTSACLRRLYCEIFYHAKRSYIYGYCTFVEINNFRRLCDRAIRSHERDFINDRKTAQYIWPFCALILMAS